MSLGRRRRLEPLGGDQPRSPTPPGTRRELRLALLRGQRAPGRLRLGGPEPVRGPLRRGRRRTPFFTYDHNAKVFSEETCPDRQLVDPGTGVHPARQHAARGVRRRAVLRRLLAQLHLGDGAHGGSAARRGSGPSARARRPGRPRVRARQRPLLRRLQRRPDPAHPLHAGQPAAAAGGDREPDERPTPLRSTSTARARAIPTPATRSPTRGTSTATGQYDDGHRDRSVHLPEAGSYLVGLRVTDNHGASATDSVAITGRQHAADGDDHLTPSTGFTWKVGRRSSFTGRRRRPQDGELPASALAGRSAAPALPVELPRAHRADLPRGASGSFPARPRVPVVPRAAPDRDRQRRADRHPDDPARPQDRHPEAAFQPDRPRAGVNGSTRTRRRRSTAP